MKTIMLLGGSAQQVGVIQTADRMGYRTILCDYLPDNPGQHAADTFYLISTTDREAVLRVAINEKIDGILAYASDPAAPTAAFVAERMGLPGIPLDTAETLCNKDRFRSFLRDNNFNAPASFAFSEETVAEDKLLQLMAAGDDRRVILKPVDSSGSKGATVLRSGRYTSDDIRDALNRAFAYSRCHRVIVEDYIEQKHPYLIGGDIFVANGEVVLWGLMNCLRDNRVNPLVPAGKSYPPEITVEDLGCVKKTLSRLVHLLKIRDGAMNVELMIDQQDRIWPIDIGPRCGGNMIPELMSDIFHVDIAELSICAAMGESLTDKLHNIQYNPGSYYATYNLHSDHGGIFEDVYFSEEINHYRYRTCLYKKRGDAVEYFDNASNCLGIIFMRFDDLDTMKHILQTINDHIDIRCGGDDV